LKIHSARELYFQIAEFRFPRSSAFLTLVDNAAPSAGPSRLESGNSRDWSNSQPVAQGYPRIQREETSEDCGDQRGVSTTSQQTAE